MRPGDDTTTPVYAWSAIGPVPGAVAWMIVTTTYSDGYSHRRLHRWTDHTAASVRGYWCERFCRQGVPHWWDGDALIREGSTAWQGEVTTWVERTTFHDGMPDPTDAVA